MTARKCEGSCGKSFKHLTKDGFCVHCFKLKTGEYPKEFINSDKVYVAYQYRIR